MDAKEAIPDITVYDYMNKLKNNAFMYGNSDDGKMYRYQDTLMDEKDLAEHSFRSKPQTN